MTRLLCVTILAWAACGEPLDAQAPPRGIDPPGIRRLTVFRPNDDATAVEPRGTLVVAANAPLIEQFRRLAQDTSVTVFQGAPIVVRIDEENGRRIATVDLREPAPPGDPLWSTLFFQGSAGGQMTVGVLTATFLQNDLEGPWIDAVRFQYMGKPMREDQWDHVQLDGTFERDKPAPKGGEAQGDAR